MYETIQYEINEGLATIRLNRPDKLNSLNPQLLTELRTALKAVVVDPRARALLLTANGRAFSAGVDLASPRPGLNPSDRDEMLRDYFQPAYLLLRELKIPTVASVQGLAIGAGMSLALTCDLTLVAESAYFQAAFVNLGIVPDTGSSWLLLERLGEARAMGALMLGERIPGSTAAEWGLVWKCLADDELSVASEQIARKLASGPTVAYDLIKRMVRRQNPGGLRNAWMVESEYQMMALVTEDAKEARKAFLEKRTPDYTGL